MVWGKLFGKKKGSEEVERSLSFDNISEWLEDERKDVDAEMLDTVSPLVERIESAFDEIESTINFFDEMELEEEVVKRLENITLTSKKKFCDSMRAVLRKREKGVPESFVEMLSYLEETESTLISIDRVRATHGRYLGIVFGNVLKRIAKELKMIAVLLNGVKERTHSQRETWDRLNKLEETYAQLGELDEAKIKKSRKEITKEIEGEKRFIGNMEKKIASFKSGRRYARYRELEEKIHSLGEKESEANHDVYEYLAPMKRTLKKFKKGVENGKFHLPIKHLEFLEGYMEAPVRTLDRDTAALDNLKAIAGCLLETLREGNLKDKKHKVKKTIELCENIVNGKVDHIKTTYSSVSSELENLRKELGSLSLSELGDMEREMERARARLERKEDELASLADTEKNMASQREKLKGKLRKEVSEIDPMVRLE
ncbi:MAG: hypothetical protein ACXQTP_04135 [Candidatus Methanofastidiosia archaeon]